MNELFIWLRVTLNPRYWIKNEPVNKKWDKALRDMLENPIVTERSKYTVKLNGVTIWKGNYPYGYGNPYGYNTNVDNLSPSRRTCYKLHKLISDEHTDSKVKRTSDVNTFLASTDGK